MENLLSIDIEIAARLGNLDLYDYIVVGSGFGGGVLANDLAGRGKKVLLIEKGGVLFSTHLNNTARPSYARGKNNSVEGNETVYDLVKEKVQTTEDSEPYVGGPVYCLGGRSNLWGLWIPQAFDHTINSHFPVAIYNYLKGPGYQKAFKLVTNGSQEKYIYPLEPNGQITTKELEGVVSGLEEVLPGSKFDLMPVATELISPAPYRFPQGAFSITTALLNRMYAKDEHLTVLLHTEVIQIDVPKIEKSTKPNSGGRHWHYAKSLTVRSVVNGQIRTINAGKAQVILSAGTIGTASIALNSGLQFHNELVGKGLIDHDIWYYRFAKQKTGSLQSPINVKSLVTIEGETALLTVTVNANFFLSGSSAALPISEYYDSDGKTLDPAEGGKKVLREEFDTIAILFEFAAELRDDNRVLALPASSPVVRVVRERGHIEENIQRGMEDIIRRIQFLFLYPKDFMNEHARLKLRTPRPDLLGFGVFSHEVGTMRMDSPKHPNVTGVVDENLKVKGFTNLHVCDLSVFPVSTEANPALTLTALSLRLAEHLEKNPLSASASSTAGTNAPTGTSVTHEDLQQRPAVVGSAVGDGVHST